MTKQEQLEKLKCKKYRDFILKQHGQSELDRLEHAVFVDETNKVLELRDEKDFLNAINGHIEDKE